MVKLDKRAETETKRFYKINNDEKKEKKKSLVRFDQRVFASFPEPFLSIMNVAKKDFSEERSKQFYMR
jgi:hypothetical protein